MPQGCFACTQTSLPSVSSGPTAFLRPEYLTGSISLKWERFLLAAVSENDSHRVGAVMVVFMAAGMWDGTSSHHRPESRVTRARSWAAAFRGRPAHPPLPAKPWLRMAAAFQNGATSWEVVFQNMIWGLCVLHPEIAVPVHSSHVCHLL